MTIARMLDKIIRRSDVLDKESLCIQSGQRVGRLLAMRVSHPRLKCAGLEFAAHGSFPCGFGKYAGLCMLSSDCCTETLPTARGGSCW